MRPRLNNFSKFFSIEQTKYSSYIYKLIYFRSSPRGNSKFGIMDIPWQRLRNQQQGTDEVIQFDKIWMVRTLYDKTVITDIENELKIIYSDACLALQNNRAGHTEWFSNIDVLEFETYLVELCNNNGVEFLPLNDITPYTATKKSICPIDAPVKYDQQWFDDFWTKQVDNYRFC